MQDETAGAPEAGTKEKVRRRAAGGAAGAGKAGRAAGAAGKVGGRAAKAGKEGKPGKEAKAGKEGKAGKKGANITGHDTQVSRLMVRAMWQQHWTEAHPGKTAAERNAAWKDAREPLIDTDAPKMRHVLATLKRFGVSMTYTPKESKAADGVEDAEAVED